MIEKLSKNRQLEHTPKHRLPSEFVRLSIRTKFEMNIIVESKK